MIELQAEAAKCDGDEGNARLTPMVGKELAGILERRKIARQVKAGDTTTLAALIFHHNGNPMVEIRNDLRRSAVKNLDEAGVSRDVAGFFRGFRKHGQNTDNSRAARKRASDWSIGSPCRLTA